MTEMPADEHLALMAIYGGKTVDAAFDQQGMPNIRRIKVLDGWYLRGWTQLVKDGSRVVGTELTNAGNRRAAALYAAAVKAHGRSGEAG